MNGKFTRIAALAGLMLMGGGSATVVPAARGDDRVDGGYVPVPRYPADWRIVRDMREPVSRLRRDVEQMYAVVSSYGADNFERLRANVYDLRNSTAGLQDAVERHDSYDTDRAYASVRHAMDDTDYRMRNVGVMTRAISDSWQRVNESFRDVQDGMR